MYKNVSRYDLLILDSADMDEIISIERTDLRLHATSLRELEKYLVSKKNLSRNELNILTSVRIMAQKEEEDKNDDDTNKYEIKARFILDTLQL